MNAFAKVPSSSMQVAARPSEGIPEVQECGNQDADAGRADAPALSEAARKWLDENWVALESSNAWVEKNGLPLARYRQF